MNRKVWAITLCIILAVGIIFMGINLYQECYSGQVVSSQPISLGENDNLNSFTIDKVGNNKLLVKMKINCSKYDGVHEPEGYYNYPYTVILNDASGNTIINQEGVLTSKSGTRENTTVIVKNPYLVNGVGTVVEESFTAPIEYFHNNGNETFHLSVNLEPDEKYKSNLISAEIIAKANVLTPNTNFLIAGIVLLLISGLGLSAIASKGKHDFYWEYNLKKKDEQGDNSSSI